MHLEPTTCARPALRRVARRVFALATIFLYACGGGSGVVVIPPPPDPVNPEPALYVVLPGQSFVPGEGVTGSPGAQIADTLFAAELVAADENLAIYTDFAATVGVLSSDPASPVPFAVPFPVGDGVEARVMLSVRPVTAGAGNTLTPVHIAAEPLASVPSDEFTVNPGAPDRLLVLLPGQAITPARPNPILSPAPGSQQVGTSYQARVRATDNVGNLTPTATGMVSIVTNDPRDTEPAPAPLVSGQANFTITPVFAQPGATVRATTAGLAIGLSNAHVVLSRPAQDIYVLLPTQALRVDPAGPEVLGVPPDQTTGTPFQVRVLAADSFGNVDVTVGGTVTLTTPDDAADDGLNGDPYTLNFDAGEAIYLLSLVSATMPGSPAHLSAMHPTLGSADSDTFNVAFSGATLVKIVLPGQSLMPDVSGPILTGTPPAQAAGTAFDVEVHALDAFGNLDLSASGTIMVGTSDGFDIDPGMVSFVDGIATATVTNALAGTGALITADAGFDTDTSSPYDVLPGAAASLVVVLPGQSFQPGGMGPLLVGTPEVQTAGAAFNVQVALSDAFGNAVTDEARTVTLTTASAIDSADINPPATATSGGVATISHTPIRARADYQYQANVQSGGALPQALSTAFAVRAAATRLAVLLPDQAIAIQNDGDGFAVTGSPGTPIQTSTPFSATVSAVDFFGNIDTSSTALVTVTTSDTLDTNPGAGSLVMGTKNFTVTPVRAGTGNTVTATSMSLATGVSTSYTVFTDATALIIYDFSTQSLSPSLAGPVITGAPQSRTAGSSFQLIVRAIDQYGNIDTSESRQITASTTLDGADTEPAPMNLSDGSRVFTLTALTARAGYTVTATDTSGTMPALAADASDGFTVSPASVAYLVVTLPGQSVVIGPATGMAPAVSGAAPGFTAGQMPAPLIGITATDIYGNRNFGFNGAVRLAANDPATSPLDQPLQTGTSGGFREYPFTPYTDSDMLPGGSLTLSAIDLSSTLPTYMSTGITVNGLGAVQLYLRFPGESIAARTTGPLVVGTSTAQQVGVGFTAEVRALDTYGNLDESVSLTDVEIATGDPGNAGPFNAAMSDGVASFTLTPSIGGAISVSVAGHTPATYPAALPRSYRAFPMVLGQADGTANGPGTTAATLRTPTSVVIDATGATPRAYVADTDNHRILGWSNAALLTGGAAATLVIGQGDLESGACNRGNAPGAADSNRLCEPRGLAVDSMGRLWVADTGNNRVLRFDSPFTTNQIADLVLGQASFIAGAANRGLGAPADNRLSGPTDVEIDAGNNVWVADTGNNRVLRFNNPGDATADQVVGQADFSSGSCNAGSTPGAARLCGPMGLAITQSGVLWVADTLNNRALRYSNPLGGTADVALGQGSLTGNDCNGMTMTIAADTLCLPEDVTGGEGMDLFVSDSANHRVLYFDNPVSSGAAATDALGQPDFISGGANNPMPGIDSISAPADLAWWAGTLLIADSANNRVVIKIP